MASLHLKSFIFNPFQENTYLLSSENKDCIIIDPGCMDAVECAALQDYIQSEGLKPTKLLLTHAHIDHILGCSFVEDNWGLKAECHPAELEIFASGQVIADSFGLPYREASEPLATLSDKLDINFNGIHIQCLLAPGHSPGSICFYIAEKSILIGGDVLFHQSIGRTDLPGGNHDQLIHSIQEVIYQLPDETKVFSGHGMETEIGYEKKNNMFVRG